MAYESQAGRQAARSSTAPAVVVGGLSPNIVFPGFPNPRTGT